MFDTLRVTPTSQKNEEDSKHECEGCRNLSRGLRGEGNLFAVESSDGKPLGFTCGKHLAPFVRLHAK